ncbi:MAG TPA: ABC transporter permease [Streptosporangiaceae bacterium]|jgi:putative ABC transport system permease protein
MFFITYLWRELRFRVRQAGFITLGLAMGVGLVATVSAASAGVAKAQATVLGALYGVGTDVTVTGALARPVARGTVSPQGARLPQSIVTTPDGPQGCTKGRCVKMAGKTLTSLEPAYSGISASKVAEAARLRGVAAAAGGITVLGSTMAFAEHGGGAQAGGYTIDGVDTADASLGPLGSASLVSGHWFTAAQADAHVAIADSGYARSHGLTAGSAVTIGKAKYTVTGIVSQPQASSPPSIYVPLARAQAMPPAGASMTGEVNTIYLSAARAADIPAVSKEISQLLPGTTVTTASSLAGQVTGSLASAARLAGDLGRWLSALALAAAFAVACLLTMAAVSRRAGDFGILKAIGWRSRRIAAQVLGESAVIGITGAAAGVGVGFAGVAVLAAAAPHVSAIAGSDNLPVATSQPGAHHVIVGGTALIHRVPVPLNPTVSAGVVALAIALALAGGLLAGALASWQIARLRPAEALARVA